MTATTHPFVHPPVDPTTGQVSADTNAVLMGDLPHDETPAHWKRADCHHPMRNHQVIDHGDHFDTVCPDGRVTAQP